MVLADGDATSGDVVAGGEGRYLVLTEAVTADEVVGYSGFETARFDETVTQSMAVLAIPHLPHLSIAMQLQRLL